MGLINEFSLQLYSLKELTEKDFAATLKRVGEIGYTGVEFAGYGELPAQQMRDLLDQNGLKSVGTHVSLEKLSNALDEELRYNQVLGTKAIIVPYYPMENAQDVQAFAQRLNPVAKAVREAGFAFGYHNHAHEFAKTDDGIYLQDLLLQLTDPKDVMLELDVYWTAYAGVDILTYMQAQRDRIRLLHLKQLDNLVSKKCVDLNEGVLDFGAIIRKGLEIGVQQFILEQEEFAVSPYQSIEAGYRHIMSL